MTDESLDLDKLERIAQASAYFGETSTSPERREFVSTFNLSTILRLIALARTNADALEAQLVEALTTELQDAGTDVPYSVIAERVAAVVTDSLARTSVPEGWRPIESAPFDHEWCVIGWEPGMDAAVEMLWRRDMQRWTTRGGGDISPTHWQPLPAPPATSDAP